MLDGSPVMRDASAAMETRAATTAVYPASSGVEIEFYRPTTKAVADILVEALSGSLERPELQGVKAARRTPRSERVAYAWETVRLF